MTGGKGGDAFILCPGFDVAADFNNDRIQNEINRREGSWDRDRLEELDSIEFADSRSFDDLMISFDGSDTSLIFNSGSMLGKAKFLSSDPNLIHNPFWMLKIFMSQRLDLH